MNDQMSARDAESLARAEAERRIAEYERGSEEPLTESEREAILAGRCGPLLYGGPCWLMPGHHPDHHCYREDIDAVVAHFARVVPSEEAVRQVIREHTIRDRQPYGWGCWGCEWTGDSAGHTEHVGDVVLALYGSQPTEEQALAEHDRQVIADYEARRKADPIVIENIDGQTASVWVGKIRREAVTEAADWLEVFLSGGAHESPYVGAGRDIIARLREHAHEVGRG